MALIIAYILLTFSSCLPANSFSRRAATAVYTDYVNARPGTTPISCKCPSVTTGICDCQYNGAIYNVEAPFAALLVDTESPSSITWPPAVPYEEIDKSLPRLTGLEEPLNHLKIMPRPFNKIKARFSFAFASLREGLHGEFAINITDFKEWDLRIVRKPRNVYILIHGFTGSSEDTDIQSVTRDLLNHDLESVLLFVDWKHAAMSSYKQSAADCVVTGNEVGLLLFEMVKANKFEASNVHLVGLDMGSHIAAIAARVYGQLSEKFNLKSQTFFIGERLERRTGLNPFARHFNRLLTADAVHDATFVDIIHTTTAIYDSIGGSAIDILNRRFGSSSLNDKIERRNEIHFYPNGGNPGLGCKFDDYGCGLNLATTYFRSSLFDNYDRAAYTSYHCSSYEKLERCIKSSTCGTGFMGIDAMKGSAYGNHFLKFQVPRQLVRSKISSSPNACRKTSRSTNARSYQNGEYIPDLQYEIEECGRFDQNPDREIQARTVNGLPVTRKQFPWAVCILTAPTIFKSEDWWTPPGKKYPERKTYLNNYDDEVTDKLPLNDPDRDVSSWEQSCTGTILNGDWVITAAHCFERIKNNHPILLVIGSLDCLTDIDDPKTQVIRVVVEKRDDRRTIFMPDEWNPAKSDDPAHIHPRGFSKYDIAMIRLPKELDFDEDLPYNAVCFLGAEMFPYNHCQDLEYSGFGSKGPDQNGDDIRDYSLTFVKQRIFHPRLENMPDTSVDKVLINVAHSHAEQDGDVIYVANFENVTENRIGRGLCDGDSGGPLVTILEDDRALLVSTFMNGADCPQVKFVKRYEHDPSLPKAISLRLPNNQVRVVKANDDLVWQIKLDVASKLKHHIHWIKEVMDTADHSENPDDKFRKDKSAFGRHPSFNQEYEKDPTPIPPPESPNLPIG